MWVVIDGQKPGDVETGLTEFMAALDTLFVKWKWVRRQPKVTVMDQWKKKQG